MFDSDDSNRFELMIRRIINGNDFKTEEENNYQVEIDSNKAEDFIFSIKQLRLRAKTAESRRHYLLRLFINGREFTQKGTYPLDSNFDDFIVVASHVTNATEDDSNNPAFLLTYKKASPKQVLRYLNKRYPVKKENWTKEFCKASRPSS